MFSATTTVFGFSAEINVALSTEVKSAAQQQDTSHFTLNSRTRAISHSTAGHEPFHTHFRVWVMFIFENHEMMVNVEQ